jgi:hypothetical protein
VARLRITQTGRTLTAVGPLGPSSASYSTFAPSASDRNPAPAIAVWCTNRSLPPSSGLIKPSRRRTGARRPRPARRGTPRTKPVPASLVPAIGGDLSVALALRARARHVLWGAGVRELALGVGRCGLAAALGEPLTDLRRDGSHVLGGRPGRIASKPAVREAVGRRGSGCPEEGTGRLGNAEKRAGCVPTPACSRHRLSSA